jgi:catalase
MAMFNLSGRVNYEPNSRLAGRVAGETPSGFVSYPENVSGSKSRARPDSFADHYNQARQFYVSQTALERQHIAAALVFELSKVESREIRARVLSHLLNVDDKLAMNVAEGLRLDALPSAATRLVAARSDLPESAALSIMRSQSRSFAGRKLGVLVTDGVDGSFVRQLETVFNDAGATVDVVAPAAGGVKTEDGSWLEAKRAPRRCAAGREGAREELARLRVRRRRVPSLQVHCLYERCSRPARARARRRTPRRRLQASGDGDGGDGIRGAVRAAPLLVA